MIPVLYIIVPCYNEEQVLPITAPLFLAKITELAQKDLISNESRVLFVNDGSKDGTWSIICELAKKDKHFIGICQSRNRGHQNAILAGLMEAKDKCDITISIDCDGQDDINAMDRMVEEFLDVVRGAAEPTSRMTTLEASVESHFIALAAERSRLEQGRSIPLSEISGKA